MKIGYYKFEGNTVHYDGVVALDLDSEMKIPVDVLNMMGKYIGKER